MFITRTKFTLPPPFKSDLSDDLVTLYRFFLKRKDMTKLPINIRKSILEPGMIVIDIPSYTYSICLRPVEDLLDKERRKKESMKRQKEIARRKK